MTHPASSRRAYPYPRTGSAYGARDNSRTTTAATRPRLAPGGVAGPPPSTPSITFQSPEEDALSVPVTPDSRQNPASDTPARPTVGARS